MSEPQTVKFDGPEGAQYGRHQVTDVSYSRTLERICVIYEGDELISGWSQLFFTNVTEEDGKPVIDNEGLPPGLVTPEQAKENDTSGANEAEKLYNLLEDLGIVVYDDRNNESNNE